MGLDALKAEVIKIIGFFGPLYCLAEAWQIYTVHTTNFNTTIELTIW